MKEVINLCNSEIEEAFSLSMKMLTFHEPSVLAVKKVVQKFPSALSHGKRDGRLPIQYAAASACGYEYVPILAAEGLKQNVGGENARGGLLTIDPYDKDGWNTLQCLSNYGIEDASRLSVLKELEKSGLLLVNDILELDLLYISCCKRSRKRFEYFSNWDPSALMNTVIDTVVKNEPLAHVIAQDLEILPMFLQASFKHYPKICGLLFLRGIDLGRHFTTLEIMIGHFGEKAMSLLYDLLTPKSEYPILHHVCVETPQYTEEFMKYFPWATQLKDHHGRSLQQAVLAAGPLFIHYHVWLIAFLNDYQIQEKDPVTKLFPFAAMAVGEHANLEKSFYLLRRYPSVLERRNWSMDRPTKKRTFAAKSKSSLAWRNNWKKRKLAALQEGIEMNNATTTANDNEFEIVSIPEEEVSVSAEAPKTNTTSLPSRYNKTSNYAKSYKNISQSLRARAKTESISKYSFAKEWEPIRTSVNH